MENIEPGDFPELSFPITLIPSVFKSGIFCKAWSVLNTSILKYASFSRFKKLVIVEIINYAGCEKRGAKKCFYKTSQPGAQVLPG